jgi:carboxyl-terminal processing protease
MRARSIVASLLFGAALGAGGWWISQERADEPALNTVSLPDNGRLLFEQVYRLVATQYTDSVPLDSLYRKAVAGLVGELDDPYSAFLPETRSRRLAEQMSGNYGGVGIQVGERDGRVTVIEPLPGAPAERAGVQPGDRIIAVEGESTLGHSSNEVVRMLRGVPGSPVQFTIERYGIYRFDVRVARESVTRRAVPRVVMVRPKVGYIDIDLFNQNTDSELRAALDSLNQLGAQSVLLDLRGNPGGLLEQGVAVAELFLDPNQRIVELRGRPGEAPQTVTARDPQWWPKLAVAVLVDENSASASEIVAGALQDNDRAIVVGRTSFGKGSAQTVYPMSTGGALRITTARWYTPLGRSITPPELTTEGRAALTQAAADDEEAVRPTYTTAMGRTLRGGGGIVPDVTAGEVGRPLPLQQLARALGPKTAEYRDAVASVALSIKQEGVFTNPQQPVSRRMVEGVWQQLADRDVPLTRAQFDVAGPWIARTLGYELARVCFGADEEFLRRAKNDPTIARALWLLEGVSSPREPFARAEDTSEPIPMRIPAFDD